MVQFWVLLGIDFGPHSQEAREKLQDLKNASKHDPPKCVFWASSRTDLRRKMNPKINPQLNKKRGPELELHLENKSGGGKIKCCKVEN